MCAITLTLLDLAEVTVQTVLGPRENLCKGETGGAVGFSHIFALCGVTEFCFDPLHPQPCGRLRSQTPASSVLRAHRQQQQSLHSSTKQHGNPVRLTSPLASLSHVTLRAVCSLYPLTLCFNNIIVAHLATSSSLLTITYHKHADKQKKKARQHVGCLTLYSLCL